jgi:hypothetical protein
MQCRLNFANYTQKPIGAVGHQNRTDTELGHHGHNVRNRCGRLDGRDLMALVF